MRPFDLEEQQAVVAEPSRQSSALSPLGGYKAPARDKMASGRKSRRKSGREQPFIDPEDFAITASRFVTMDRILERHVTGRTTPGTTTMGRRDWIRRLGAMGRKPDRFSDENGAVSRFSAMFERASSLATRPRLGFMIPMGIHGVGTSPSASTHPAGEGRFQYELGFDGLIRRGRKRGKGTISTRVGPVGRAPTS